MSEIQSFESSMFNKIFVQALTFGIVAVILGTLFIVIFGIFKPDLPQECEKWNQNYIFEMIIFLVGFTMRYLIQNEMLRKYLIYFN